MAEEKKYYLIKEIYNPGEWYEDWLTDDEVRKIKQGGRYCVQERDPPNN